MSIDQMIAVSAATRIAQGYESESPFITLTKDAWINALAKAWLQGVDKGISMGKAEVAAKKKGRRS